MTATPTCAADITAQWLRAAAPELAGVESVTAERLGEGVGMMTELYRLTLKYREGASGPRSLVVKQPAAIEALRDVANAYGLYEREVLFYRDLAQTISLRAPRCYIATFDPETCAFALVMEDLSETTLGDQVAGLTPEQVTVAVDQVGDLHARWWDRPELKALEDKVQSFGTPPYADFSARHAAGWEVFDAWLEGRVSPDLRRAGARMCTELDRIAEDMAKPPRTLCHGDFRADNLMFVTRPGAAPGLTCVDWQLAMQARGPFDIGYMMGGSVNADVRRELEQPLLKGYHDKLRRSGVENYSFEECLHDYRRALLITLTYMSQSGAAADLSQPRTEALYDHTVKRIDAAIHDHGLMEFVA
ncbi:MAG TPA: phosphotransferase [Caulobacteraceae bacterium]|nr:phosphotransferase [Caulobacteraceae bacterium]